MLIFDLPATRETAASRVVAQGSCRIRNPFLALQGGGGLKVRAVGLAATHTAAEARQSIEFALGLRAIPAELFPYVFGLDPPPETLALGRLYRDGFEAFALEISDNRQFRFGEVHLQQNFFFRNFVKPYRGALLDWYREICLGVRASAARVEQAIQAIERAGAPLDDLGLELLRGVWLERPSDGEVAVELRALRDLAPVDWLVMGAITVPDDAGVIMVERRALNRQARDAALEVGASFFDPTEIIVAHGRQTALDGGGADINEYAEAFYPTVGETLLDREPLRRLATAADGARRTRAAAALSVQTRLNAELCALHAARVAELGIAGSGLFEHYDRLLQRRALIGPREIEAADAIDRFVPSHDFYVVLRAGLGELAFLLAAAGRRVIACEPHARRRAAIEAGLEALQDVGLVQPGDVTVSDRLIPDRVPGGSMMAVALDAAQYKTEAEAAPSLEALALFDGLLIDPRLFLCLRASAEARDELLDRLRREGFDLQRRYPAEGLVWCARTRPRESRASVATAA